MNDRMLAVVMMLFGLLALSGGVVTWVTAEDRPKAKHAKEVSKFALLPDRDKIELLRSEAAKRGLHWHITCNSYGDDDSFFGMAFLPDEDWKIYIEDNAKPFWSTRAGKLKTQGEAALALYEAILEEPNAQPLHKRKEKICVPALSDKTKNPGAGEKEER